MNNPNIREIVEAWLKENGYDGLVNDEGCGCGLGQDFMPCDGENAYCQAAYRSECPSPECDNSDCPIFGECEPGDLCMTVTKPHPMTRCQICKCMVPGDTPIGSLPRGWDVFDNKPVCDKCRADQERYIDTGEKSGKGKDADKFMER